MIYVITVVGCSEIMANGVHSSDIVHMYLSRVAEEIIELNYTDISNGCDFDGDLTYSGDIDIGAALEEDRDYNPAVDFDGPFAELDDTYSVLSTTASGNQRVEGLDAVNIGWDAPVEGRTWRDWKQNYREEGLTEGIKTPSVTDKGEIFLDKRIDDIDTGEFYRALSTKGSSNSGKKIKALILQPSGLTHNEISKITGMPKRTVTSTFSDLEDIGVLNDDQELTNLGKEGVELIKYQLEGLETL
ncbi:MAG: hypothetical protein V5A72_02785 [Candidatus Nanohaloarchaea archaeon]